MTTETQSENNNNRDYFETFPNKDLYRLSILDQFSNSIICRIPWLANRAVNNRAERAEEIQSKKLTQNARRKQSKKLAQNGQRKHNQKKTRVERAMEIQSKKLA